MKSTLRFRFLVPVAGLAVALAPLAMRAQKADTLQQLHEDFLHPPDNARPMVRWWWFGPAVTKPEILRELQQMKADGVGGAELAFVYAEELDDPARGIKNLSFLSPEMLDAVTYAKDEGRKLGLRIDVTLCSGWPYGGPNTPLSEAATRLVTREVVVPPNSTEVKAPALGEGESIISASILSTNGENTKEKDGQPCGFGKGTACGPATMDHKAPLNSSRWNLSSAQPLPVSGGTATVSASPLSRVAVFFILGHTKQQVKRAAVGSEGYVLDPFSHQAVKTHLDKVGEPLVKAFGSTPPYAIFSDSLEAYGADWTPNLPAEFQKRRGYDLIPHLPELVAGGTPEAEKVRHDWGVTLTELVNENYLTQIDDWAKAHGTKFRSQTYGEPAVDLSSQRLVALPEGEGPQWRAFSTLRWATSANHLFGNNVTSGETFTWLHSPIFRAVPLDMKAEADIDFIMGENQLVFHGWPYSPPNTEIKPGWSLYAAGAFDDVNPWHPVMPAVTKYIQRMSWMMRQGEPANQVALLLPTDDAWASFTPEHVTVTGALQKLIRPDLMGAILSAGYNVDFIDAKTIDRQGIHPHTVLVLPSTDRIPVETLKKIDDFAAHGGKVIAVSNLPSMDPEGKPLTDKALLAPIALVPGTDQLEQALHHAVAPDLRFKQADESAQSAVGFIRRKLHDADVYYVVNTSNRPVSAKIGFGTDFRNGDRWNPETGEPVLGGATDSAETSLNLAPYESALYVFSNEKQKAGSLAASSAPHELADITSNWKVDFLGTGKSSQEARLQDWTSDPATLHYSGEVVYSRDVDLQEQHQEVYLAVDGGAPEPGAPTAPIEHGFNAAPIGANGLPNPLITRPGPGIHAWFNAPIREAALVTVNGQPAGALWHPPYRLDVTKFLKPGTNHIEIHVYNTALNAWSALPPHNYKPLIAKYGDKFQVQDLDKVKPVSSGILGTIHLVSLASSEPGK